MNLLEVSSNNTKAEILTAYHQLKGLMKEQKQEKQLPFREQILASLEEIETEMTSKKNEVERLDKQIEELKSRLQLGEQFEFNQEKLEDLKAEVEQEKQFWQRHKQQLQEELEEEEKWQKGRLEKELQQREWESQLERKKKEQELTEREEEFKGKTTDYKDLRERVEAMPAEIARVEEQVTSKTEKRLQAIYESEKKYLQQEQAAEKTLFEQKIHTLESRIEEYKAEIKSLTGRLNGASQQIKQLAVAALESKKSPEREDPNSSSDKD